VKHIYTVFLVFSLLLSCSEKKTGADDPAVESEKQEQKDSILVEKTPPKDTCDLEKHLIRSGLVDIQKAIPGILIDLRYSDTNNFMHTDVYGDLDRIYLQPDVAEKLKIAQEYLQEMDSSLTLLVFDGVRPRSVQQIMWDTVNIPINERGKFVSNPKNGSLHNYGAAVDLTIAKLNGEELDMGTPYDDASPLSYPTMEAAYLEKGELTKEQIANRKLLRAALSKGGFWNIQTEWWHFNSCNREQAKGKYQIIE
jgi:D-alanyl-D-alanine dipeptidase